MSAAALIGRHVAAIGVLDGELGRAMDRLAMPAGIAAAVRLGRSRAYLRAAQVELRGAIAAGVDPVIDQAPAR